VPGSGWSFAVARDSWSTSLSHDLDGLPDTMQGFVDFYERRRERMKGELVRMLQVPQAASTVAVPTAAAS
jgi:hypothetical protein